MAHGGRTLAKLTGERAEEIAQLMQAARADTLRLFDLAREADLHQSPGFGYRPIIWHLAHIGVFEAYWILQQSMGEEAPDKQYEKIFDPIQMPREESKNLPSRGEMEKFLREVRERTLGTLDRVRFDEPGTLTHDGYVFHLVLEHECQHQETLAYLLHLLDPPKKTLPRAAANEQEHAQADPQSKHKGMATVPEGEFLMGAPWKVFAYDNEHPVHPVNVSAFKIDRLLTTNDEYARFIEAGGYERREWWTDEGWAAREREGWTAPLYWRRESNGEWREQTMFDERHIEPDHPVSGLSWYEADAYARFMGKRLPTEAEWEKAASWDAERESKRLFAWGDAPPTRALCNFGNNFWGTTPVGSFPAAPSPYGCLDMTGNVWEWTSDAFMGYPGFEAFPYPEYSEKWFDGDHCVLKGGSWATRAALLRTSFRNFFRRPFRIAFAGVRCASDA